MSKAPTNHTITTKDLREHLPRVINAVALGHSFTVVKRAKEVFQISPIADEGNWQTIADFTQISTSGALAGQAGVPVDAVLAAPDA